jgi:CRISPR-associated exonuclease Cas4
VTLLYIALGLLLLSLGMWAFSRWQQVRAGLPAGRVVYLDTAALRRPEGALFSANFGLTGRPDYLVNQGGRIIPIEVKSSAAPAAPHPSHIYQLAAYALLIEEHFRQRPAYGILKYKDRTLQIPFTPQMMDSVHSLIEEMRADIPSKNLDRSHVERARCAACGFRDSCDQSLA